MNAGMKKGGRGPADRQFQSDRAGPFAANPQDTTTTEPEHDSSGSRASDSEAPASKDHATGNFAEDTLNTVKNLAQSVTAQASNLASNIGQELGTTAEANVASGANALRGFAKAMQTAAQELEAQSPTVARHVRDAAGQMESFSEGISNRKVGELLNAASDFARHQPTVFIAGAVLGGFAFARFLKSSSGPTTASQAKPGSSPERNPV